jgi:hypothetical protein
MSEPLFSRSIFSEIPEWVGVFENIANKLFVSSFVLNKLKDLPLGWYSTFFANTAMFAIAFAYSIQIFTTHYYQVSPEVESQLNYKDICQMIATIGTINSWICISLPQVWLICLWAFCLNNGLWIYNEQTRIETPSIYPPPPPNQKEFCRYVNFISIAPLCSAISNTLALFYPYADQEIRLTGKVLNWLVSFIGLQSLYRCDTIELSESNQHENDSLKIN